MVFLERLSTTNFENFKRLNIERFTKYSYDKNFFDYYDNEKFFLKIFLKKFVKLFIYKKQVIGYMWYEIPVDVPIRIWSLYIKPEYIKLLSANTLKNFDNTTLSYESPDDEYNNLMLINLGFRKVTPSILMNMEVKKCCKNNEVNELIKEIENNYYILNKINEIYNCKNDFLKVTIEKFRRDSDEELRCAIQNSVFSNSSRVPLDVRDIENDIIQDYYIDNLSLFIKINGIAVGYGQVIYNRGMYTVVNFGIVKEFRGMGLGKILLNQIINLVREMSIDKLFIRVEEGNTSAIKLYNWIGFNKYTFINKWER